MMFAFGQTGDMIKCKSQYAGIQLSGNIVHKPEVEKHMSFQNFTKSIVIAASLTLAPWTVAWAQSNPEDIVEGWVSAAEGVDFLTVTHGGISHDGSSDVTTINGLTIQFTIDGAKMSVKANSATAKAEGVLDYTISFPTISFSGLMLETVFIPLGQSMLTLPI